MHKASAIGYKTELRTLTLLSSENDGLSRISPEIRCMDPILPCDDSFSERVFGEHRSGTFENFAASVVGNR